MVIGGQCNGNASQVTSCSSAFDAPMVNDPRAELDIVQAEVARVSQTLKALMDRTHGLKARINDMYSPAIRLFPPEVTAEIFQACIPAFDMEDTSSDTSIPLMLGSVCTSWRRIAWSAPTLWSSLTLRLSTSSISTQITLLDEWLSRSGDLPLSLRLFSDEEIHWVAPTNPGTAIEVIRKYASRWKDLDLRLPTSCYKFLPASDETLPLLRSLNLNPPGGQGERRHKVDMSNSAKIQHLSLSCVYLISMKFQWVHVTHLRLEAFYVDECLEALRQSPQLEVCSLHNIIGGDDGHVLPSPPLILPALHTLSIENEKDTHIALLLDTIAIPQATYFSYTGRTLVHTSSLCSLIARSAALESVAINQSTVGEDDSFNNLLRAMKGVKKLVFKVRMPHTGRSPLDDDLLRLCNPTLLAPGEECLLPRLEHLEYRGPQTFTWPMLIQTMESRARKNGSNLSIGAISEGHDSHEHGGNLSRESSEITPVPIAVSAQSTKIFNWKSMRLNLTRRQTDLWQLPDENIVVQHLKPLLQIMKVSVEFTSIGPDASEEKTIPLVAW